ncbi:MAG: phosphatidate cytidylyltransferase [Candidatus Saccharibacteria bacterium]
MAVSVEAGHFSTRIVPALWIVLGVVVIVILPWPLALICLVGIIGIVASELTHLVDRASERAHNTKRLPWAIEWVLIMLFPSCIILVEIIAGKSALVWLIGTVFVSDVGAFYGGKALSKLTGGHKLAVRISPGKTWEGVFTGLLGAALWTSIMLPFRFGISPGVLYCLALCLAIVGMAGDLLESWLKRQADVKDSSLLLRDHGGMLDRNDGLLAAAPVAVIILWVLVPS